MQMVVIFFSLLFGAPSIVACDFDSEDEDSKEIDYPDTPDSSEEEMQELQKTRFGCVINWPKQQHQQDSLVDDSVVDAIFAEGYLYEFNHQIFIKRDAKAEIAYYSDASRETIKASLKEAIRQYSEGRRN